MKDPLGYMEDELVSLATAKLTVQDALDLYKVGYVVVINDGYVYHVLPEEIVNEQLYHKASRA